MEVKKDRDRKAAVSRTERWDGSCEMTRGNGTAEERNEVACWALPSTHVGLAAVDLLWPHLLTCWFFFFFLSFSRIQPLCHIWGRWTKQIDLVLGFP